MKKITLIDVIIFLLFLIISALSFSLYANVSGKPEVHITSGDKEWVYDLSVDELITVEGPIGKTIVEILDNRVHIHSSDCKNQICVLSGWIDKPGQWLSCLPNDVFVLIKGEQNNSQEEEIDDVAF